MNKSKIIGIPVLSVLIGFGIMGYMNRSKNIEPEKIPEKKTVTMKLKEGEVFASYGVSGYEYGVSDTNYAEIMTEEKFKELYEPQRKELEKLQDETIILQDKYEEINLHINSMKEYSGEIEYYCPMHKAKHTELYYNSLVEKRGQCVGEIEHHDFILRNALSQLPRIIARYEE